MLILYMYFLKLYLLMSYSSQVCIVHRCIELTFILFTNKIYCPRACYIMLWLKGYLYAGLCTTNM